METYKQPLLSTALAASLTCGFALLGDGEMTIFPPLMREILAALCFLIALGILFWLFLVAHRLRKNKRDADVVSDSKQVYKTTDFITKKSTLIGLGIIATLVIGIAMLKKGEKDATKEKTEAKTKAKKSGQA